MVKIVNPTTGDIIKNIMAACLEISLCISFIIYLDIKPKTDGAGR